MNAELRGTTKHLEAAAIEVLRCVLTDDLTAAQDHADTLCQLIEHAQRIRQRAEQQAARSTL
jgi:hypothetical protein